MKQVLLPLLLVGLISQLSFSLASQAKPLKALHAITLDKKPKYPANFKHLDYVNPNASKTGELRLFSIGGFDTFNPFNIKGDPAAGIGRLFEPLMSSPEDDSLSQYGLIAKSVEVPEDLTFVIYNLRPEAKFHDNSPITAEDVVFSMNILKSKGRPIYRFYYANVSTVEALGPHRVKFSFSGPANRELPQIVGQLPILSKSWWKNREFSKTTLEPPNGS